MELQKVLDYIDEHKQEYIELLQKFCQQPSVSATGEGIDEMVSMVYSHLKELGAQPECIKTNGNPVIYGHIDGESPKIFGFYDHYDVQPVDPIELWNDDPFSAVIKDGVMYARGVADNKDGLVTRLCAVDAWQKVYGKLPVGVKFLFEGEEEVGSPNLTWFAENHPDKIKCDGYVWEGGYREIGGPAQITMGVKGLLYVELVCNVSKKGDAHSCYAAIMESAAWKLVRALNTLKDENENILIDGWCDDIPPITQKDIDDILDTTNLKEIKEILGIDHFLNDMSDIDTLIRLYLKPTCNICGITTGYQGPGSKTVLPALASAKIDFRLVPNQDPDKLVKLLRKHLDKNGFEDIEIKVDSGCPAFRSDPDSPFCKAIIRTMKRLFKDEEPIIQICSAGTSPMYAFCLKDNIPASMFGASSEAANIHAPNEHLAVESFINMIKITATMMDEMK